MSIISAQLSTLTKPYYYGQDFHLNLHPSFEKSKLTLFLKTPTINTRHITQTYTILQKKLPSILQSTCFNDEHLPFHEEVLQTEIGHLFEHILLEYLCERKLFYGYKNPIHNGTTIWNWEKDIFGTFHIQVDAGLKEEKLLYESIQMSISLLEEILEYDPIKRKKKIQSIPFSYKFN